MKLKTSIIQAIERGKTVKDSKDIELLGTEALSISPDYKRFLETGKISSSQNSFLSLFGINVKFFYSVRFECERHGFTERGLGYIYENEGKFFLNRFRPFYIIEKDVISPTHIARPITCSELYKDYIVVSSYIPSTFTEVLTESHSVITSEHPHLPTSVVLQENSVLGRNTDGLVSIPLDSLIDEEIVRKSVTEHNKNLSLKSPKVDVKRLTANDLQLNAKKTAPARKGVIYYDESDDCLKYYDGTGWRRLMWQKDD